MRRRIPGASRAAAGAADVAERVHLALRKAQGKLLNGQQKLQTTTVALRSKLPTNNSIGPRSTSGLEGR